jgi:hypothetical protein
MAEKASNRTVVTSTIQMTLKFLAITDCRDRDIAQMCALLQSGAVHPAEAV